MVGKAKRPRLHQAAPRLKGPRDTGSQDGAGGTSGWRAEPGKDWAFLSSDVFAGMKIDPKTLVKKLDLDSRSVVSAQTGKGCSVGSNNCQSVEEKTLLPKKEKMKLRKERWLQKIEGLKLARQKQKAEAKRKATPVVGDMQPLLEALPELSELTTASKARKQPKSHRRAKAEPTDFNQMKPAQKRKLLEEEVARFHEVIANPVYKANPLAAISEHLCKRLKEEAGNTV
ncbi:ribosome biogenesis protein SLX9 homolog isoform X1 [Gopherus flavomarginatus]|uniref:ribosome biogenesis protein SLX9 homolog isoform X1 n=1 Tax=Gopherus flavomarginatus TaxID=286002 RepID=UPI0021CC4875|nr:ribosome biogenesis protein SLX9 homolog isoform X1 [Gopherus flavomarginatus]